MQQTLQAQFRRERLASDLLKAPTEEESWRLLADGARDFGFSELHAFRRGKRWSETFAAAGECESWSIRIQVNDQDSVELKRPYDSGVRPIMVSNFVDTVRRVLQDKLKEWEQLTAI